MSIHTDIIMSIPEGGSGGDNLRPHLENIKFLKAFYGHAKAYVECHPSDKGAFQLPDGKWITEMDIKPGVNWQVRHSKFQFKDWLMEQNVSPKFLERCVNYLFPPKTKWISAVDVDSFNHTPKEITSDRFDEATKEGFALHETESECQKECDHLNSL